MTNLIVNQWELNSFSIDKILIFLIGWDGGVSFLGQSQSKVKGNQSKQGSLSILNWQLLSWNHIQGH